MMFQTNLLKVILCLIIAALLFFGPYTDFIPYSAFWSADKENALWQFICSHFIALKYVIILLCFLSLPSTRFSFIPVTALAVLFGLFNWFCSEDSPGGLYNYNTHLNLFITGLAVVLITVRFFPGYQADAEKKLFQFCQCYVLTFYLQSGLSKLIFAGTTWLMTGRTAWVFALELGTDFGKFLAHYPVLFAVGSFTVVMFEILIFPLYLLNIGRKYLILGAVCLHLSVFLIMGISFWHLWMLYPAIFYPVLFPAWHKKRSTSPAFFDSGMEVSR
ncbi:hypothetical protein [uncultured Pantoea sp.]|uniref:hypothetical protein n=1 Tax=uncultured Pantoea sp. TaxID=218084 RepID=UPI002805EEE4|nr:hypothetical protein [uncultured Pantoea sp.]